MFLRHHIVVFIREKFGEGLRIGGKYRDLVHDHGNPAQCDILDRDIHDYWATATGSAAGCRGSSATRIEIVGIGGRIVPVRAEDTATVRVAFQSPGVEIVVEVVVEIEVGILA